MLASSIMSRALKFMLIPFAATKLGPELFGTFYYAMSVVGIFYLFSDLGISGLLLKEYPFKKDDDTFLSSLLTLRIGLVVCAALASCILYILLSDPILRAILLVIQGYIFFNKATLLCQIFLQAAQKMGVIAIADLIASATTTGAGLYILYKSPHNLFLYSVCYFVSSLITFAWVAFKAKDYFPKKWTPSIPVMKATLIELIPFWFTLTTALILQITDTFMIKWLHGADALGIYKAALKIPEIVMLPGLFFVHSLQPVLSEYVRKPNLKTLISKATSGIVLFGLPILAGGVFVGRHIMDMVYSQEYVSGAGTLMLLNATILLAPYLIMINHNLLTHNLYKVSMKISSIAMIVNVGLNLLLIPKWWIFGAAIGTVAANSVDAVWSTYAFCKGGGYFSLNKESLFKIIGSTGIMATGLYLLPASSSLLTYTVSGGTLYAVSLLALREEQAREILSLVTQSIMKVSKKESLPPHG